MQELQLTKGQVALVDDEDFIMLAGLRVRWCLNNGYAYNAKHGSLHRFLLSAPAGKQVDHVNGNKLDCRRKNMRLATPSQNQQNRKRKYAGLSVFKGAHWDRSRGHWMSRIRVQGKLIYLGVFDTDKAAGAAYNEAAKKHFGRFAALNDMKQDAHPTLTRKRI